MCTSANRVAARGALIGLMGLLAAGCAVGPDFKTPAPPKLDRYAQAPAALEGDGTVQSLRLGQPADAAWWRMFGSPQLDALVQAGLDGSPTLTAARAALAQSQDQTRAGASVFYPSLGGSAEALRERNAPAELGVKGAGSTFSLYTLAGSVSYAIDLFGGERRSVEALGAAADYQRHAVGAAYLTLTGDVVETAIARAGYADEVDTLGEIVRLDQALKDVAQAQYQAGPGAESAVLAAEQQLDDDQASLAEARQRLAASETLLQTLTGREPAESASPPPALNGLTAPAEVPLSLPSQLVRQRPDILEAEAALHQASAQVGVATAALFPSISLSGDYGAASTSLARLANPAGRFWSVGPSLDLPIFEGGARWFGRKAAQAAYLKAQADYRQTVLAALEQTSDALKALEADAEVSAASRRAFDAADEASALAEANRQAGVIADADAIGAAIQADRARLALTAARAQRLQDVAALYLACGGGWTAQSSGSGPAAVAATP